MHWLDDSDGSPHISRPSGANAGPAGLAESLFEALADSAPDAIVTIDEKSTILAANRAVKRVFGYDADEVIGRSMTALMPERLREPHHRGFSRYLASGQKTIPWTGVQLTGLTKDQREIPIEVSFGEFVDSGGRRLFSGFVRDISDRVRQQRALEQAFDDLQLQAQLFASVEEAIISTDENDIVLTWNQNAEALYGWSPDEAIGRRLSELLPLLEPDTKMAAAALRLRSGNKVTYERQVRRRDGEIIWVSVVAAAIRDAEGRITRIVGTSTDISERRRLEAQFLQAQKMDAIGRLAGGIAHDFNNMLTVITANAEFLLPAVAAGSEAETDVLEIAKTAARAAALTGQLLAFSRQQLLEHRPVRVNEVVSHLERMLSRLIGEHIDLAMDLANDVPMVLADPGQLEQAIVNLVINARDAMPEGGALRITTRRVLLTPEEAPSAGLAPGEYASIAVADTGHGMSREVQAQVFEPFFTTKESGKGTGLGLATVYGLVQQSRGSIEVESNPGQGSIFTIKLPGTALGPPSTSAAGTPAVPSGSGNILIVEDQVAVRAVTARILTASGYTVIEVCNGVEALNLLRDLSQRIDLVITDAVMPHLGGTALIRAVRRERPDLPFIMMSGYTDDAVLPGDEAAHFIQKPFKRERLLAAVRAALEHVKGGAHKV